MSQVEELSFHFVLPYEDADEEDSADDMKLAFTTLVKYGANAKWIQPSSCATVIGSLKDVLVFEKFEGTTFEEMKKYSAQILGPRCILTCLSSGRSLPNGISPIYTEGMRDIVVCCSGFDAASKRSIQEKVEYMGGLYVRSLRGITTHLVAANNTSRKAIEAYKSNVTIMKLEWVNAVWERSLASNVNGRDEEFKRFESPLFHNLKITTSGIARKEKDKMKELIESNGGTFTGILEDKSTNILIVSKPEGDKFKFAKMWNIDCVRPGWLYNCVSTGTILPVSEYVLESGSKPKSSTPKKGESNRTANFSMMSVIAHDPERMVTHLEETHGTLGSESAKSHFQTPKRLLPVDGHSDVINNVLLKNAKDAGLFLDGCNVYLCGFNTEDTEKLKKVLNVGGATRFDELTEFVTHVIVGKQTESLASSLAASSARVVSVNWLAESVKLKKPAPETDFVVLDNGRRAAEPPSPLSKLGAKLLTTVAEKTVEKPAFCLDKENDKLVEELLSKYKESQPGEPLAQRGDNVLARSTSSSLQSRPNSTQSTNEDIFKGLTFFLSGELSEEERRQLEEIIAERCGQVVGKRFLGVPDYAVVPVCGASLSVMTTKEVVNVFFIKDCCLEESLVPLQYYHYPVACVKGATPLKNCVISVSNYVHGEREFIETLIEILGAVLQSLLARKPKENILKSTHLVCAEPSGQKYNGALRWGLPVVHHDWLLKCASLGIRVSEQPYLVGDSKLANDTSVRANQTNQPEPPQAVDKTRKDSPVVHDAVARLKNSGAAADSPDQNRTLTPTSPYGAFYGNDNPSPGTRKRLWKWMHQGADFPQDPPMNYDLEPKRRDSTPLSTVLSKLLLEMKRKPEEVPRDSPARRNTPPGPSAADAPPRRLLLDDAEESPKEANADESPRNIDHNEVVAMGLERMKKFEENYTKKTVRPTLPARKHVEKMVIVAESQPQTEVGWEDPTEKEIALDRLEKAAETVSSEKVFMLTRIPDSEEVARLIEESGGKVSRLAHFDKTATHVISNDLTRDEKLIGSIAAGLWVLHPSYIDELRVARDVNKVAERGHEWGNPDRAERTLGLSANARGLANASHEWRLAIKRGEDPPFKDMKLILHLRMNKYESFKRLIEAGGGEVINAKPPYRDDAEATICVAETGYTEEIDFEALAKRKVPCVNIFFVNDRVLRKPSAIDGNLIQAFAKFWTRYNAG